MVRDIFPDAPTERGVKHLNELADAVNLGYNCYIAFVIAMEGIDVLFLCCEVEPDKLVIQKAICDERR